jgi:hypothetical protein
MMIEYDLGGTALRRQAKNCVVDAEVGGRGTDSVDRPLDAPKSVRPVRLEDV